MLVRITDHCAMGCSHCMVNADKSGRHMDMDTFMAVFEFSILCDRFFFLSGGEPTSHPQFLDMLECTRNANLSFFQVLILSNGTFLEDKKYTDKILEYGYPVQITNDDRFYPKQIEKIEHPLLTYIDRITHVSPFGRALENKIEITQKYPGCFNLRSIAREKKEFRDVVMTLRLIANKFCTPSINTDGSISAGETPFCGKIGTVDSTFEELLHNLKTMSCNKCGLDKNLEGNTARLWEKMNGGG